MRIGLAWRYALGLASLKRADVLLASFPRSGSTWLRFLVVHAALEAARDGSEVSFARLNRLAPELGASSLRPQGEGVPMPRLIKTHRPYSPVLARPRSVLLVRSPLDALASYHRYWTARAGEPSVSPAAFLRDPRRGLQRWIRHTRSWQDRADLVVCYADLQSDPAETTTTILRLCGVTVDADAVARAVTRSEASAVRALEASGGVDGTDRFARGTVFAANRPAGSGADSFDPADRAWAERQLAAAGMGVWVDP